MPQNTYTKKAIEMAIKGGYQGLSLENKSTAEKAITLIVEYELHKTLLDRDFWQALEVGFRIPCKEHEANGYCVNCDNKGYHNVIPWMLMWRNFVEHLIEGKDIESFFQSLLANT